MTATSMRWRSRASSSLHRYEIAALQQAAGGKAPAAPLQVTTRRLTDWSLTNTAPNLEQIHEPIELELN